MYFMIILVNVIVFFNVGFVELFMVFMCFNRVDKGFKFFILGKLFGFIVLMMVFKLVIMVLIFFWE